MRRIRRVAGIRAKGVAGAMRSNALSVCTLFLFAYACMPLRAGVRFGPDTLASLSRGEGAHVAIEPLCGKLRISTEWDSLAQRLTCSRNSRRVVLFQEIPVYQGGDSLFQLPYAPVRSESMLYLRAEDAAALFYKHLGVALLWSPDSLRIILADSAVVKKNSPTDPKPPSSAELRAQARDSFVTENAVNVSGNLNGQKIKTIVIDPGHGGLDPGAIGPGGVQEKEVVLGIAKALRDLIKKEPGITVHLTRETDVFIPLNKRTQIANDKKADLFVSIHANSIGGNSKKKMATQGYKIYFLSQEKNEEDKLVAMQENAVIELEAEADRGNYLHNVLVDMAGNEFLSESQELSIMIDESFDRTLKEVSRLHLGVGQARFYAYMPAVLVETAFISHPSEEKLLKTEKFQQRVGKAVFEAIRDFKRKYEAGI
jgi:N-acetylmuramoyl-L-alanine amidase